MDRVCGAVWSEATDEDDVWRSKSFISDKHLLSFQCFAEMRRCGPGFFKMADYQVHLPANRLVRFRRIAALRRWRTKNMLRSTRTSAFICGRLDFDLATLFAEAIQVLRSISKSEAGA